MINSFAKPESGRFRALARQIADGSFDRFYHHPGVMRAANVSANEMWLVDVSVDTSGEYFGWWSKDTDQISMIYRQRVAFDMCFPYGHAVKEKEGRGRVVNLTVRPVRKLSVQEGSLGFQESFDLDQELCSDCDGNGCNNCTLSCEDN